jgi:hypothetical protein
MRRSTCICSEAGRLSPRARAVRALKNSRYLLACSIGRSAGRAPFRILALLDAQLGSFYCVRKLRFIGVFAQALAGEIEGQAEPGDGEGFVFDFAEGEIGFTYGLHLFAGTELRRSSCRNRESGPLKDRCLDLPRLHVVGRLTHARRGT